MNNEENECKECLEQARLLGMSAEREADLLGKLERERALADRLHAALDTTDFNLAFLNNKVANKEIEKMRSIILLAIAAWKEARNE